MVFSDLTFPACAFFMAVTALALRDWLRQPEEVRMQRADVRRRITLEMMREADRSHGLRYGSEAGIGESSESGSGGDGALLARFD